MLTTELSGEISPSSRAFFTPAVPVTPAGSPKTPQVRPSSLAASRISWSETLTTTPLDSRMAFSALSALRGTPTAMESARVFSSMGSQGLFSAIARFSGQQPSAWTLISRGSRSIMPVAYRSLKPFQTPAMVQPSPTERAT